MKESLIRRIEIFLSLIIIICVFFPFVHGITPFQYAFHAGRELFGWILVSIPLTFILVFHLLTIFQTRINQRILNVMKIGSFLLFFIVFSNYVKLLIEEGEYEYTEFLVSIIASLALFLMSLRYKLKNVGLIQNMIIATMTLPFVFHFPVLVFRLKAMNVAGWIMESAFVLLYLLALVKCFLKEKNASVEN